MFKAAGLRTPQCAHVEAAFKKSAVEVFAYRYGRDDPKVRKFESKVGMKGVLTKN